MDGSSAAVLEDAVGTTAAAMGIADRKTIAAQAALILLADVLP